MENSQVNCINNSVNIADLNYDSIKYSLENDFGRIGFRLLLVALPHLFGHHSNAIFIY